MSEKDKNKEMNRRSFLQGGLRTAAVITVGGLGGIMLKKASAEETVWQIDPDKCVQCEKCATNCVMDLSAVKCVHAYDVCGYCKLCGGYYKPGTKILDTAAENQLCPTGALKRTYIENPYYEYTILEDKCIGCAKCVKGCGAFGNGSLFLQVRHDRCLNCNECAIAVSCPSKAFRRVPAEQPYLLRGSQRNKKNKEQG